MSSSDEVVISEAVIEKIEMNRTDGNSNLIEYYTPVNYSSLNLILYGSLAPTNIFNSKSSKIFTIPLSKSSPNNFQGDIIIDGNDNSGYFIFYSLGNISTPDMHFFNIKSSRSYFRVINNAPIIIEESSLINGIKFEETNDNDSYYINEVSTNFPVTILLKTEEIVNYEDQIEDLSAIMIYLTVATSENTSTLIFPNLIPKCDLDFHEQGEYFGCDFTIPNSLEYNGTAGTLEISQQSSPDFIYLSLLLLTIRDSEGASSDYIFLLYVNVNPTINNMLDYIPIIILFIVIISIIWIVYIRSKPKHVENDEYYRDDWESYENSM